MTNSNFNEEDKKKFIEFLNLIAKSATFEMKTDEIISYFKLLAHAQQVILPKIDAHILEVVKVHEEAKATEKEVALENKKRK
jgi:hypothetical protein